MDGSHDHATAQHASILRLAADAELFQVGSSSSRRQLPIQHSINPATNTAVAQIAPLRSPCGGVQAALMAQCSTAAQCG